MTGIDWSKFAAQRHDPEAVRSVAGLISKYFRAPTVKQTPADTLATVLKSMGQKFSPSDANLAGTTIPMVNVYSNTSEPDFGYERIFDLVDMRQSTSKTFEILDATNGVTFVQILEGEKIKVRGITTAKASVGYLKFGGGLGFLDDWFRFNQYYLMDDILRDVRAKYFDNMASIHYGLITALTGITQAFNVDDVTTINDACAQIISDVRGLGFGVGENPVFKIVAGAGLKARLAKAVASAFTNPNANNSQIVYRIDEIIATPYMADTNYWVMLPGIKSKRGVWDDLNAESQRDALRRAEDMTWEGKFNGAIGQKKQVRMCNLS